MGRRCRRHHDRVPRRHRTHPALPPPAGSQSRRTADHRDHRSPGQPGRRRVFDGGHTRGDPPRRRIPHRIGSRPRQDHRPAPVEPPGAAGAAALRLRRERQSQRNRQLLRSAAPAHVRHPWPDHLVGGPQQHLVPLRIRRSGPVRPYHGIRRNPRLHLRLHRGTPYRGGHQRAGAVHPLRVQRLLPTRQGDRSLGAGDAPDLGPFRQPALPHRPARPHHPQHL